MNIEKSNVNRLFLLSYCEIKYTEDIQCSDTAMLLICTNCPSRH